MQDRYAGDVGDFLKLSLLQRLAAGRRLGVAWYLFPDETHNSDGRHVAYLQAPERWRHLNPGLFDALAALVRERRSVAGLHSTFETGTMFATEPVPVRSLSGRERSRARSEWFERTKSALSGAEIVFADPDNGLTSDDEGRRLLRGFGKQIPLLEADALAAGRTLVIYHHNSRFKGGHDAEVDHWIERLTRPTIAIRCNAYSCRTFFVVGPDVETVRRATEFCDAWRINGVRMHLHPVGREATSSTVPAASAGTDAVSQQ